MTRRRRDARQQKHAEVKRLLSLAGSSDPTHRTQAAELLAVLDYPTPLLRGKTAAHLTHYRVLPKRMWVRRDGLVLYVARCQREGWYSRRLIDRATVLPAGREAVDRSWAGTDLFDLALRVDAVYPLMLSLSDAQFRLLFEEAP